MGRAPNRGHAGGIKQVVEELAVGATGSHGHCRESRVGRGSAGTCPRGRRQVRKLEGSEVAVARALVLTLLPREHQSCKALNSLSVPTSLYRREAKTQ